MRWLSVGLACLALAGCSKAPDRDGPGEVATTANGVAFAYRYDFRLPSSRIADAQEAHAQACEQLTPARCRITGMSYRLDGSGQVAASLDVRVAAPIARAFGRRGVQGIETTGALWPVPRSSARTPLLQPKRRELTRWTRAPTVPESTRNSPAAI